MGLDIKTLAAAKKYTKETAAGGGAIQGQPGKAGKDGITPHIGDNGNWYIGDVDTGISAKGKDGKSITNIASDKNNNIIVTFSDNTTQNIGKLTVDVQADFLTSGGFGNLRYYNDKFQSNKDNEWVDVVPTPDNIIVVNMTPSPMQKIIGIYDHEVGKNKLKWLEPEDTVVDGQIICVVDHVVIRRKLGSEPENESDGDLVLKIKKRDFSSHNTDWWFDDALSPFIGDEWYYKAFPIATTGLVNASGMNECICTAKDHYMFGVRIDQNESNTAYMVTYLHDNVGFTPVGMNFTSGVFNYGDWGDFWFLKDIKPCMLKYDGTVAYFLNTDNLKKKVDGTDSDVSNIDFEGNAMNQNPVTYWKMTDNGDGTSDFVWSDKKFEGCVYWQNIDENGNEIPYFYTPCYDGYFDGTRQRSLSGFLPTAQVTRQQEIDRCEANNVNNNKIWHTTVLCDIQLLRLFALAIGSDSNTQSVYGGGNNNSYVSTSNTGVKKSGLLDDRGLFYGYNDNISPVKLFGIENFYGNIWKACAGWVNDNGTQKVKMTYGTSDGSTVVGYNTTGDGYITISNSTPAGTSGGYINRMLFTENGIIPKQVSGSATTYFSDGLWFNNEQNNYAMVGDTTDNRFRVGAFSSCLDSTDSLARWNFGASLSCKPLAQNGGNV